MNKVDLNLLGSPAVLSGGQPVQFATHKALALLIYLVVEASPQSREKLMSMFWPESETRLAHSALRNTLVRIKQGLQGVIEPLLLDSDQVGFNTSCLNTLDLNLVTRAAMESVSDLGTPASIAILKNSVERKRDG